MDKFLAIACFLVGMSISIATFPDGPVAVLMLAFFSLIVLFVLRSQKSADIIFLRRVFIIGLLLRVIFGALIYIYGLRGFFGGDSSLYDLLGHRLYLIWFENFSTTDYYSVRALDWTLPGWGMNYLVGFIYTFTGRNVLAAQSFCAVVGAATALLSYRCSYKIYGNRLVARTCAVLVAVFPAFVIWSSQLLKDGLIIFLLVLAMTMVLELQERFGYAQLLLLVLSLFGILSLRFYIFYMVVVAVVGSFVISSSVSAQAIIKRVIVVLLVGLSLAYIGALRNAGENFDEYSNLERIQKSRQDLTTSESGFGSDQDVSTTGGAITALPVGFAYLMFAPFPWQVRNFRQAIALPEVLLWWALMPFLVSGLIYTIKYRFRNAVSILLFSFLLTIGYSVFQGNVGTAYRQRTQIQIFLYMFIGVGWSLRKEKQENRKLENALARQRSRRIYEERQNQMQQHSVTELDEENGQSGGEDNNRS